MEEQVLNANPDYTIIGVILFVVVSGFKLLEWIIKQLIQKDQTVLTESEIETIKRVDQNLSVIVEIIKKEDGIGGNLLFSTPKKNNELLLESKESDKLVVKELEKQGLVLDKIVIVLDAMQKNQEEESKLRFDIYQKIIEKINEK